MCVENYFTLLTITMRMKTNKNRPDPYYPRLACWYKWTLTADIILFLTTNPPSPRLDISQHQPAPDDRKCLAADVITTVHGPGLTFPLYYYQLWYMECLTITSPMITSGSVRWPLRWWLPWPLTDPSPGLRALCQESPATARPGRALLHHHSLSVRIIRVLSRDHQFLACSNSSSL